MKKHSIRLRLNLRMIATVDFRHGVPFHYDDLRRRKLLADIAEDETILLISGTGMQLAFIFLEVQIKAPLVGLGSRIEEPIKVISHYRVQLSHRATWNPTMLSEYAGQAGIELIGIKRFEDHLRQLKEEAA